VRGGLGGHSGTDIAHGRANAIKVLGRVLREALAIAPFRLVSIDAGRSWNAIPRDAAALCSFPPARTAPRLPTSSPRSTLPPALSAAR
jgi:dipeptidase D